MRLPLEDSLNIAKQIAEALEAAHEKGAIHPDLKPANVKVTPEGMVKVLDFGLAKLARPVSEMAVTESLIETPAAPIENGLEMACRVDSDVPDALIGDCNRLRQVVVNLVSNGIKFTESPPILRDTTERKLPGKPPRRAHDEDSHQHPVHGHTPVRRPLGDDAPLWLTGQWLGRRAWPLHSMARQTVTRRTEPPKT